MAKDVRSFKVFIAAPSDVDEECRIAEEVIHDMNITLIKNNSIHLDLLRWNTHCYLDMGSYPQEVINNQIGDDYDIFIGIMWKNFGTPTPVAGSGTAEEFQRAYTKYQQDPSSVKIMFYFKDAGISSLSELDPDQLRLIQQFRTQLGHKGGLYHVYNDLDSFKRYIRLHLDNLVSDLIEKKSENITAVEAPKSTSLNSVEANKRSDTDEEGFFDLIVTGQECFQDLTDVSNRISEITTELGKKMTERTKEIDDAKTPSGYNAKTMHRICNRAAADMDGFAERLKADIPTFAKLYKKGIDSFGKAYGTSFRGMKVQESELNDSLNGIVYLKGCFSDTLNKIKSFRNVIDNTPSATRTLIRSRKQSVSVLDEFIGEFEVAINLTSEIEKIIAKRMKENNNAVKDNINGQNQS